MVYFICKKYLGGLCMSTFAILKLVFGALGALFSFLAGHLG